MNDDIIGTVITEDPKLDATGRLTEFSAAAINSGEDLGFTEDIDGEPRPSTGLGCDDNEAPGPDLGADEFQGDATCGVGPFIRGDCDLDGDTSSAAIITDVIFTLTWDQLGGETPGCLAACDYNGDGLVGSIDTTTDVIYLLTFSLLGGSPPPAPFPDAGLSASEGDLALGCDTPLSP